MPTDDVRPRRRAADAAFVAAVDGWWARRGWAPFAFQRQVQRAMARGRSGLLHATTGAGKTLAAALGAWQREAQSPSPALGILWLTPMRALAADTTKALGALALDFAAQVPVAVGERSGDTTPAERARQDRRLPTLLVTTPESATLLMTRADAAQRLGHVHTVVVDEWHELVGTKRGVQVQLLLARLAHLARARGRPLVVWGLSATLGNLDEAMATLVAPVAADAPPRLVRGRVDKTLVVDTLLPHEPGRFSWGGHLGAQMVEPVAAEIERAIAAGAGSTLVFTNVRSQAEAWYRMLLDARPAFAGRLALHHGSLDKATRAWVEQGLKDGSLAAVVATSSLDLGVDFVPVERVLQVGSAKGVARLLQRAGRSGHQPGRASRITLVPTNTLELVEAVAARRAVRAGRVEPRHAPVAPLDVLVQHLVSVALGGGFEPDALFDEVRTAWSYRTLTRDAFDWALAFVVRGGASLGAYPEFHRVVVDGDGRHTVTDRGVAQRHRMQVGTIVGEATMQVKWWSQAASGGASLGSIEESFVGRLNPGDHFVFGGRLLEFVRARELVCWVKRAEGRRGIVPSWAGSKMPLSTELADATLEVLAQWRRTHADGRAAPAAPRAGDDPELQAAWPMLDAQARLSELPAPDRLLIERWRSREGHHLFVYPFAGRLVHLGLASLLAWRMAQGRPNTFSIAINDHGFELLAAEEVPQAVLDDADRLLAGGATLFADVVASLRSSELARKRFREIARVAGLVTAGYPGAPRSARQLQATSGLFYDVFVRHDPQNRLLQQADAEALSQELELDRLGAALARMRAQRRMVVALKAPAPFAVALMVERFRERLTTEKLADRLARIVADAAKLLDA